MTTTASRMVVEVGGAQRGGRSRERLERRFQLGQAKALRVGGRRFQPGFNRHGFFTEMDTPSRSGTIEVSKSGCAATRAL